VVDTGRVHKKFYQHPKAIRARAIDPGSISLWLFANCWCRNHRGQGAIPKEKALELGTAAEIDALVESRLWVDCGEYYQFHDWCDWNPDLVRRDVKPSAIKITQDALPDHPFDVQNRVATEVLKLIDEGLTKPIIEAALRKWAQRPDARVTWIPYFASDAIREGETGLAGAIKEARRTGDMSPLREFGWRFVPPELPDNIRSAKGIREYMQAAKSRWLDEIEAKNGKNTA